MNLAAVAISVDAPDGIEAALERARRAVQDGARLVEWRVDELVDHGLPARAAETIAQVRRLVGASPAPCIVTVRSASEGGGFRGADADRVAFIEAIGTGEPAPRYLDVELSLFERSANLRQKIRLAVQHDRQPRDLKTSLILSAHDFDGRPGNLSGRVATMAAEPACAVIKIAWRARSIRDDLEAFELLHAKAKPMVALCMGEFGLLSRVLAPKFGGLFTFVRAAGEPGTAPGQPTARELFERYRYGRIGRATAVYGVVGWPLSHSRSPDVHNAGFDAAGLDAVHLPMPVEGSWESFKATVGAMVDFAPLDLRGLSVTAPHKEHLVRFVRERGGELCPLSARCGSANTLVVGRDGGAVPLRAVNTDGPAAVDALLAGVGRGSVPAESGGPGGPRPAAKDLHGRRVALLGAGGAARAIAAAFADAGAEVRLHNRTRERAEALVRDLADPRVRAAGDGSATGEGAEAVDTIVNATSAGLAGGPSASVNPLPPSLVPGPGVTVMETIYGSSRTPLLEASAALGATIIDGAGMFIRQAERQFELWTGAAPSAGLFRRAFEEASRVRP